MDGDEGMVVSENGLTVHHVGIAVAEIGPAAELYVRRFGYSIASEVIHDPRQTALVQFLKLPGDRSFLEFVAPDGPGSKLTAFVNRGGGLNHICFAVPDIDKAVEELRGAQMVTLCEPVSAVAFPGRRIAWLLGADRVPIELVEQGEPGCL